MQQRLFPRQSCPACGRAVRKLRRKADGGDMIAIAFMDVPFWLLFGLCVAVGMVNWLAGAVSVAILIFALYLWDRSKSLYQCDGCEQQSSYRETVEHPSGAGSSAENTK